MATSRDERIGVSTTWLSANAAFVAATCVPVAYVVQFFVGAKAQVFSGGGAAAFMCVLIAIGLVFRFPGLIKDGAGSEGEASTMRVSCLAVVFSFVAIVLRTGWNSGSLPSLEQQSNWVFLVSAAIGGKALQSWIELNASSRSPTGDTQADTSIKSPSSGTLVSVRAPQPPALQTPSAVIVAQPTNVQESTTGGDA